MLYDLVSLEAFGCCCVLVLPGCAGCLQGLAVLPAGCAGGCACDGVPRALDLEVACAAIPRPTSSCCCLGRLGAERWAVLSLSPLFLGLPVLAVSLSLSLCLSASVSLSPCICLSVCLSVSLSVDLFRCPSSG